MVHILLKALVFAEALIAPNFHERPIRTEAEAVAAFYEQWRLMVPNSGTLQTWQKQLHGNRKGPDWVLQRGGRDRMEIHVDAATGRLGQVTVID
jgi:hypothetical protein